MWYVLVVLVFLLAAAPALAQKPPPVPAVLYTAETAYTLALADLMKLPPAQRRHCRYLWVGNDPAPQELWELVSFVSNSLNFKRRGMSLPARVDPAGRLLRLDLAALYIDPEAWDFLGEHGSGEAPFPEPYFHIEQEREIVTTTFRQVTKYKTVHRTNAAGVKLYYGGDLTKPVLDQVAYTEDVPETQTKKTKKVFLHTGAVSKFTILALVAETGTDFPVFRADWFVVYAMSPPAYHKFMGDPKNFDDFLKVAGVNKKIFQRESTTLRGAVVRSEVAKRNRALERSPSEHNYGRGFFAQSFDFKTSLRKDDVFKNLLQRRRDAGELIFTIPNGLQGYGLVALNVKTNVEERIDFADPRVAVDRRTSLKDPLVWNGWKCVTCHANGLIPLDDEVRTVSRDTVKLLLRDKKHLVEGVADRYFGAEINELVVSDQAFYNAAVKAATGKTAAAIALAFQDRLRRYYDVPLGIEDVCLETGYPLAVVRGVLEVKSKDIDATYTRLLRDRKVRRDQHEEAFAALLHHLALVPVKK